MIVNPCKKKVNEKTVIVTGASSGFGAVLVRSFQDTGYRVACCGRNIQPIENKNTLAVTADVRSSLQMRKFCETVVGRWGGIDVVVANAGVNHEGMLSNCSSDQIDDTIATNIGGVMNIMKHAGQYLVTQGGGHMIAISSYVATRGNFGLSLYGATKSALTGLVRSLAKELGPHGVQVNAVMPGFMDCGMGERVTPQIKEMIKRDQVLLRLADPDESAGFIVYLADMRNVSGQLFNLDSRITGWI
ncbi:MAG: SDR family oxidoreductase [Candidatus Auribacterota bacterium]|nr:SDR family oxidoreductase [Candidatus Auribacterota bacterium]